MNSKILEKLGTLTNESLSETSIDSTFMEGKIMLRKTDSGFIIKPDKKLREADNTLPTLNLTTLMAFVMYHSTVDEASNDLAIDLATNYTPKYTVPASVPRMITAHGAQRYMRLLAFLLDSEQDENYEMVYKFVSQHYKEVYDNAIKREGMSDAMCSSVFRGLSRHSELETLVYLYVRATRGSTSEHTTLTYYSTLIASLGHGVKAVRKILNLEVENTIYDWLGKIGLDEMKEKGSNFLDYLEFLPDKVKRALRKFDGCTLLDFDEVTIFQSMIESTRLVGEAPTMYVKAKRTLRNLKTRTDALFFLQSQLQDFTKSYNMAVIRSRFIRSSEIYKVIIEIDYLVDQYDLQDIGQAEFLLLLYNHLTNYLLQKELISMSNEEGVLATVDSIFNESELSVKHQKLIEAMELKYTREIEELQKQLEEEKQKLTALEIMEEELRALKLENTQLKSKNKVLTEQTDELYEELKDTKSLVEVLMNDDPCVEVETKVSIDEMVAYLSEKSIGVFGGRLNWGNALVELAPTITWYPYTTVSDPTVQRLHSKDYVFFNGLAMGHKMAYKFSKEFNDYTPLKNIVGGAVVAIEEIYNHIKSKESKSDV